jgi:hypothetical protein
MKINQLNIKNKFLFPAIVALIIAAVFTVAYFNEHKALPKSVEVPSQSQSQSQSSTSTDSQGNIGTTEGDGNVAPLPETQIGSATVNNAPAAPVVPSAKIVPVPKKIDPSGAAIRDDQRETDMRRLMAAQFMWYSEYKRYYTCSDSGGDCRGKANNLPSSIGSGGNSAVDPINYGRTCGQDYIYCGLNNVADSSKFCYYAKLEGGGYYTVSFSGYVKRNTIPASLKDCLALVVTNPAPPPAVVAPKTTVKQRDSQRESDMVALAAAQANWYKIKGVYYACGATDGDCQGKMNNYPVSLGIAMAKTPVDPVNSGMVCGRDQVYCGLNNVADSSKFCYYAKLEGGGYYTASNAGNFERTAPPATFGECGQPN